MGGILLVISAAIIIVVTALLFDTADNQLEIAYRVILGKVKVNELGQVDIHLKMTDISPDIYVQVWGLDGDLQASFGILDNFPEYFVDKPLDPYGLFSDGPVYRDSSGP